VTGQLVEEPAHALRVARRGVAAPAGPAIEHQDVRDGVPGGLELARDLERDRAAERPAGELVRPARRDRAQGLDVARGHRVHGAIGGGAGGEAVRGQAVDRLIGAELARELDVAQHAAADRVDAEHRRTRAAALDRHQARRDVVGGRVAQHGRERLERLVLEQRGDRQLAAQLRLDRRDQRDRVERVAAEREEVVGRADRGAEHALPHARQAKLEVVARGDSGRDVHRGAGVERGERAAVDLAVRGDRPGGDHGDPRRDHRV